MANRLCFVIMGIFLFLSSTLFSRILEVELISDEEWLVGNYWLGGVAFNQSISYGSGIVGESSLPDEDAANVTVHFSTNADSQTVAPVYSADDLGVFIDWGSFPGTIWDVSGAEPRRLNICFYEEPGGDLIWNPDHPGDGNHEYLLIMNSDYDEGAMYDGLDAFNMDVQYFSWLKKYGTHEWMETLPASLEYRNFWELSTELEVASESLTVSWEHENPALENEQTAYYKLTLISENGTEIIHSDITTDVHTDTFNGLTNYENYVLEIHGIDSNSIITSKSEITNVNIAPVSMNTQLLGNWVSSSNNPYSELGLYSYNDIWGYIDENSIEYALIGSWDGTYIIDISTSPSNPQEVGFIPGSLSTHRDIKTFGHYMYIGTEANLGYYIPELSVDPEGIQIVDLSDPYSPILINEWNGVVQSHNIMEADGYLYVIGSETQSVELPDTTYDAWGLNDLIILDLASNPENPELVGSWNGDYLHDVCIYDDILYGCGIVNSRMYAFDISDKTNPVQITEWGGVPSAHACWVSEDGNTVFTGSETNGGHIMSFDVSDIENGNVNLLDEWMPPNGENWSAHNLFVKGEELYISYYAYGLQILDISDPENMVSIGFYDTFTETVSSGIFSGAWGTFPFYNTNKVVISNMNTGLYVVNFDSENLGINCSGLILKPDNFSIQNIFPNPFNPSVSIKLYLNTPEYLTIQVLDLNGRVVESINERNYNAGRNMIFLNGEEWSSGVYLLQVSNGVEIASSKMVLTK